MRRDTLLTITTLIAGLLLVAGCGGDPVGPRCGPTSLAIVFQGTLQRDGVSSPVTLSRIYSADAGDAVFARLDSTLLKGRPTGTGTTVWRIDATTIDATLQFQFGGAAAPGTSIAIAGVPPSDLRDGAGPAFSAIGATGLFLGLAIGPAAATTAAGTLLVTQQTPLAGHLTAAFGFAQGSVAAVDGNLAVTVASTNCPE